MRNSVLVGLALIGTAASPASAATYVNDRFGYSVVYPADALVPQPEAPNGDGREFRTMSGRGGFAIYGTFSDDSPRRTEQIAERVCRGTAPTLRIARRDLVAMSCLHGDTIYYTKILLANGSQTILSAAYPIAERGIWDRIVERMARSLRPAIR